jgi:hypothetical protein
MLDNLFGKCFLKHGMLLPQAVEEHMSSRKRGKLMPQQRRLMATLRLWLPETLMLFVVGRSADASARREPALDR